MIKDKLGESPINKIQLGDDDFYFGDPLNCSSVTLNELLSVMYFNMADDGIDSLYFESFP